MIAAVSGSAILSVAGAVLGLAVLLGGVIAVLFSQLRRNTTAIVREENEDLRNRLRTVEMLEETCKERLASQEATTQVLSDMVTGASAVSELGALVGSNHEDVIRRLDTIDAWLAGRAQP